MSDNKLTPQEYQRQYAKDWNAKNGVRRAALTRAARERDRQRAFESLGNACQDCGGTDQRTFEFDHREGDKAANVPSLYGKRWERVEAELAKCDLVCANCHAIRTWTRHQATLPEIPEGYIKVRSHTHCPQGHEKTPENRYSWGGKTFCRPCRTEQMRERRRATNR